MPVDVASAVNQFQIALSVCDLSRSTHFYRILLGVSPTKQSAGSVRFEMEQPPLALTLTPAKSSGSDSTLNHLGLRIPDQPALVAMQRRLEEAGIATQRQEGVECCYALQTKFWVTDPDRHLWELYVFHEDLDHSGFDDHAPQPWKTAKPEVWTHLLTDPLPDCIPGEDASIDEVRLEGTFNASLTEERKRLLLAEIARVLKPGGKVAIHGMAGDKPFAGEPQFPGIAGFVKAVPTLAELIGLLGEAGFSQPFLEKFEPICLSLGDLELRELRLLATKLSNAAGPGTQSVLYRGPFQEILDDAGQIYRRGERTMLPSQTWDALKQSGAADQFVFFP